MTKDARKWYCDDDLYILLYMSVGKGLYGFEVIFDEDKELTYFNNKYTYYKIDEGDTSRIKIKESPMDVLPKKTLDKNNLVFKVNEFLRSMPQFYKKYVVAKIMEYEPSKDVSRNLEYDLKWRLRGGQDTIDELEYRKKAGR